MKYIKGFDGLRAISVIFVVLTHSGLAGFFLPESNFFKFYFFSLFAGTTGVKVFFTLSGFLITTILLKEKLLVGRINIKVFFIKRALRLFPPLILFFLALIPLILSNKVETELMAVFYAAFYVYNFIPRELYSQELGHTWSLAIEEQFYLMYPFVINFFNIKRVMYVCVGVLILCIGVELFFSYIKLKNYKLESEYFILRWFIPSAFPIIIGCLLAIFLERKWPIIFDFFYQKPKKAIVLGIFLYCFPLVYFIPLTLTQMIQPLGVAVFIGLLYCHNTNNFILKVLEFSIIRYIGRISYGIYLYQGIFLGTGPKATMVIQEFPLNILLTFTTAIISYELIEKRVLNLKGKFINKEPYYD